MSKQFIFIIVATVLAGGIVAGVWYAVHKPGPRDLSMPPIYEEPGYTQPEPQKPPLPQDDSDEYVNRIDSRLRIYKYVVLDPEVITIDYELKDVTLCGQTYKTKQIIIDGVDVVQRLAQLLDEDPRENEWYCKILLGWAQDGGGLITAGEEIHIIIDANRLIPNDPSAPPDVPYAYSFTPHLGVRWAGGLPIYVYPQANELLGQGGHIFGTLR